MFFTLVQLKDKFIGNPFNDSNKIAQYGSIHLKANYLSKSYYNSFGNAAYFDSVTSELIISGSGELHLEVMVDSLKEMIGSDAVELGNPVVALREIPTEEGKKPILSKSTNKLNNVLIVAVPLDIFTTSIANENKVDGNYDNLLRELESAPDFNSKCVVLSEKFAGASPHLQTKTLLRFTSVCLIRGKV